MAEPTPDPAVVVAATSPDAPAPGAPDKPVHTATHLGVGEDRARSGVLPAAASGGASTPDRPNRTIGTAVLAGTAAALIVFGVLLLAGWWLLLPSSLPTPPISLPPSVSGMPGMAVPIEAETRGRLVRWLIFDAAGIVEDGRAQLFPQDSQWHGVYFISPKAGRFGLVAVTSAGHWFHHATVELASTTVTLGDVPPGPGPGPGPTPGPAPIPADGLHVLVVYETADLAKLPKAQELILYSQVVRDYLNAHCPAGPDGKTHEWRIWDQNTDTKGEAKIWQDAMARKRDKLPWLVLSNPQKGGGYEGPLPASIDEMMALLKRYGE